MARIAPRDGRHRDFSPMAHKNKQKARGPGLAIDARMSHRSLALLALLLSACGSEPGPITSETPDTGAPIDIDTGAAPEDTITIEDTGTVADSGAPEDTLAPDVATDTASEAAPDAATTTAKVPAELLDLTNWKLTLPIDTDHAGSPDEIKRPELDTYSHKDYFRINDAKTGVMFRAHCGGYTTSGSGYPRSELREMTKDGTANAAWSPASGTHKMVVREAITHLPVAKPDVVAAQIHDSADDVIEIRLRDKLLFVEHDGANYGTLDAAYALGTTFTVEIRVTAGKLEVFYNGVRKVERTTSGSGYYFKAGAYTQSNTSKGDLPTAYGEVMIYDLKVTHE
jgi:hypothetical protein